MITNASSNESFNQIYLAFDIHDVLAEDNANKISASLFQAYGMILQVPVEGCFKPLRHYIYPFVKELFQLLAETSGVHIAFSTSSKEIFAKSFVKQFLTHTFGQEKYAKIADKICICAHEQLRDNESYNNVSHSKYSTGGNQRKDLDDVYPHPDIPKKQKILIDDSSSFAAPHQMKNLFNISGFRWTEQIEKYQRNSHGLYFCRSEEEFEKIQNKIESGNFIALYAKQVKDEENNSTNFVIVYYDGDGEKYFELSLEESIIIKELYDKSVLENSESICEKYPCNNEEKAIIGEINTNFKKFSDPENSRLIFINGIGVSPKACVKQASFGDIAIQLGGNGANIYFPQNPERGISLKNHVSLKLLDLAREYWSENCTNIEYFQKNSDKKPAKAQLYDLIWDKVKDLVWKEKMIYQANHILLLTGAIFSAWEESKTTQKSISKILFNWQCEGEKGNKKFTPGILVKRTELYSKGLELLRIVNPKLEPITIKSFESALEKYPSLPDDGAQELKDECIIS